MDLDDDDLSLLGYGNQWEEVSHRVAVRKSTEPELDKKKSLDRVNLHHRLYPERHAKAIADWQKRNPDRVKQYRVDKAKRLMQRFGFMVGKQCVMCGKGTQTKADIEQGIFGCKECK